MSLIFRTDWSKKNVPGVKIDVTKVSLPYRIIFNKSDICMIQCWGNKLKSFDKQVLSK